MPNHRNHVQSEEEKKEEEVSVILVTKAVVHKRAMMIKTLHTFVTVVAVHCILWSKILAVDTDVVQMELFIHESLHQAKKVFLEWNIPWIYQSHTVEYDCQ